MRHVHPAHGVHLRLGPRGLRGGKRRSRTGMLTGKILVHKKEGVP